MSFYVALSILVTLLLYNNCAPSFQSAGDINNHESRLSSAPLGSYTGFESLSKSYNCQNVKVEDKVKLFNKNLGPLTKEQYQNSIKYIFGVFINDIELPSFYNDKNYNTTLGIENPGYLSVDGVFESAGKVIDEINKQANLKNKYFSCAESVDQCLETLFGDTGKLLFKREMTGAEKNLISVKAKEQFEDKSEQLEAALYLLLTSPQFSYHSYAVNQTVNNGGMIDLSELDLAQRLSFFIWGQVPDENLLSLAEQNILRSNLPNTVRDMLQDERSIYLARALAYNWFNIGKFKELNQKAYSYSGLQQNQVNWHLSEQVTAYINDLIKNNRPVTELFKSNFQYHTLSTAKIYNVDFDTSGLTNSFSKVELDNHYTSAGVLTHIGVLAENSSPGDIQVHGRGNFIIDKVLCEKGVGEPSGNVFGQANPNLATIKDKTNDLSNRVKCGFCHTRFDPYGIGLENFDGLGRYRDVYGSNGEQIDYTSSIGGRQIASSSDLGNYLATEKREIINYCATKNILSLATGKKLFDDGALNERNTIGSCVTLDYFSRLNISDDIKFQDLIVSIVGDSNNLFGQTSKLGE